MHDITIINTAAKMYVVDAAIIRPSSHINNYKVDRVVGVITGGEDGMNASVVALS